MGPSRRQRASEGSSSRHDRITDLFERVFELEAVERAALYGSEGVDPEIAAEVEQLIGAGFDEIFEESRMGEPMPALLEAESAPRLSPGARFGGYEIVREIARGGMGRVFEARQLSLGRRVALKVVLGSRFAAEQDLQRFRLEAEAIARLDHPGIVPVYEVGERDGEHFFSMAFVGGGSLADLEVPVQPRRAAKLVEQVAEAVHFAHSRNIVHRDLKPANVLLSESLSPKVSDFGLAKDLREGSEDLTRDGSILGTPGFLAPEQARGDHAAVGPAADVYGLGGVLFYLLTGKAPIRGDNLVETMHRVLYEEAPSARSVRRSVPQDLDSICARCLEKDPAQRYGSALALAEDLRRYLAGEPIQARPVGAATRLVKWIQRRPAIALAVGVAVLALLGGGATSTWFGFLASRRAETVARQNTTLQETNRELERARGEAVEARNVAIEARDAAVSSREEMESFSRFLVDDVISAARDRGVRGGLGRDVTLREALLTAAEDIGNRFVGQPLAEALARHDLGVTLRMAGELEVAEQQLRRALEIRTAELGSSREPTLESMQSLSACLGALGRHQEALQLAERVVELGRGTSGLADGVLLYGLAEAVSNTGHSQRALEILDEVLVVSGTEAPEWRAVVAARRGGILFGRKEYEEALAALAPASVLLVEMEENYGTTGVQAATLAARCLIALGRIDDGIAGLEAVLPRAIDFYTAVDRQVLEIRIPLLQALEVGGRLEESLGQALEVVSLLNALEGESERYFFYVNEVVQLSWELGDHERVLKYGAPLLEHRKATEPYSNNRHSVQALLTDSAFRVGEIERSAVIGVDGYRALLEHSAQASFRTRAELGYAVPLSEVLFGLGRYAEAIPHQQAVIDALTDRGGAVAEPAPVANKRVFLGFAQLRAGDPGSALRNLRHGLEHAGIPEDSQLYGTLLSLSGRALQALDRPEEAKRRLTAAQPLMAPRFGEMWAPLVREQLSGMLEVSEVAGDAEGAERWRKLLREWL